MEPPLPPQPQMGCPNQHQNAGKKPSGSSKSGSCGRAWEGDGRTRAAGLSLTGAGGAGSALGLGWLLHLKSSAELSPAKPSTSGNSPGSAKPSLQMDPLPPSELPLETIVESFSCIPSPLRRWIFLNWAKKKKNLKNPSQRQSQKTPNNNNKNKICWSGGFVFVVFVSWFFFFLIMKTSKKRRNYGNNVAA